MRNRVLFACWLCLIVVSSAQADTVPTALAAPASRLEQAQPAWAALPASSAQSPVFSNSDSLADALVPVSLPVSPAGGMAAPVYQPLPHKTPHITTLPAQVDTRMWWGLTIAQHAAAVFDSWSTRQSIGSGRGYERDPLLRPFADSPAIYPAMQVLPTGLDYLSRRMQRSSNGVFRRMWWVPQTAATVGFVWSGIHNLGVASR